VAVAKRIDPCPTFRFVVEIESLAVAGFNEVSGLEVDTDVQSFREGGENKYERQLAGPTKFPSRLTLKRGVTEADGLWTWFEDASKGRIQRRNVTVVLMNGGGEEVRRWAFQRACPVKWVGPRLAAGAAEVAFESVEFVHWGLQPV
jgi:phage tail-like protein